MFLLWGLSCQHEPISLFGKIARRVYALFPPIAMEKKVPSPVNPALRKPFSVANRRPPSDGFAPPTAPRPIPPCHSDRSRTLSEAEGDGGAESLP
jgi:hypothetical protein